MEKIQVIQPTKLLAPYIKQYWFLRIDDVKQGFQRSIPAGCVALVFHKGNKIISSFHKGTQPQSYISGQISTYSDIEFSFLAMRIPFYRKNGVQDRPPHGRCLYFENREYQRIIFAYLNSSLFYCWYSAFSDGFHLTDAMVKNMPINEAFLSDNKLSEIGTILENDIKKNSFITTRNTVNDDIELESFRLNSSKNILDCIDKILAKHYSFTEEELDFIINYDIKYRMGDELNEE